VAEYRKQCLDAAITDIGGKLDHNLALSSG